MGGARVTDEEMWKRRFFAMTFVRLVGTALGLTGLAIGFGDLVRPGGMPWLGFPLIVIGLLVITLVPRAMSRRWRQP